jgi:hypothetical protein
MKHLKILETYACNMHVYATSRSTFATSRQNTCNIRLEQMKHLEHTLETYVYSYYNMCNISIYFATSIYNTCNVSRKHLKHLKHTITTCAFNVTSPCCLDEWRLVDAELDTGMELKAAEWREGHRFGTRRRHGLWSGQGQADGAWPRREVRV